MNKQITQQILVSLYNDIWLMDERYFYHLLSLIEAEMPESEMKKIANAAGNPNYQIVNDIAIIPISGIILRKFGSKLNQSGITSLEVFNSILADIKTDQSIKGAMLVFDSPGGTTMGVEEAASNILDFAQVKPIVSYVEGYCCSAAYWLASQTNEISATDSAEVGSIGVYTVAYDCSKAFEKAGIKTMLIRSGQFKGVGIAGVPILEEDQKMLQERVDKIGEKFSNAVMNLRNKISPKKMQGQSFDSAQAKELGFVDHVTTKERVFRSLLSWIKISGK